eukprot:CAMPEP_0195060034 /NCGR_PEP_ID=MMETSP0448-20130528/7395_1 /TAXON_ID=66468 /ORGANISM="Heterocapsa triquestra, Strain CCMP 448" /LENGTH=122 /DNA_ID=CAMNT_0040090391 /DNA_START=129 /DNA_END=495 /DNA_ORIENTATION=-
MADDAQRRKTRRGEAKRVEAGPPTLIATHEPEKVKGDRTGLRLDRSQIHASYHWLSLPAGPFRTMSEGRLGPLKAKSEDYDERSQRARTSSSLVPPLGAADSWVSSSPLFILEGIFQENLAP